LPETASGARGEITRADVDRASATAADGARPAGRRVALTPTQRMIAARLSESWRTVPHITSFLDVELDALVAFRAEQETRISATAVFIAAVAHAASVHPIVNASFHSDASEVEYHDACHVSVATQTESGLLVPVVRDAGEKSLEQIERELTDLTERARHGRLTRADGEGGTITLTNIGRGGIHAGTPIISPPQVAIVGVGSSVRRPVVRGEAIVPGLCCTVDASFDHRVIDGMAASGFLRSFGDVLEDPRTHLS
jgi:pyruvate/2-oxoglutarate dehydrogenase complex dihydrolipoamide acyltransferase (E2) component